MKRTLAILLLTAGLASAQVDHYNPVNQGMMDAVRITNEIRQQQLAEQSARLMRAQEEQIRLQNEQLRQARGAPPATASPAMSQEMLNATIDRAIAGVVGRHDDYREFAPEMARLIQLIESREITLDEYLEGVYLMAKYSPFSKAAKAGPSPLVERLQQVQSTPTIPPPPPVRPAPARP